MESGENMVKYDPLINEERNRKIILMTSDKVMKAATEIKTKGVMDATFKVINISSSFPIIKCFE